MRAGVLRPARRAARGPAGESSTLGEIGWEERCASLLKAERARATPLIDLGLTWRGAPRIFLKDERAHPSGSLKHRLVTSLIEGAIRRGSVLPGGTIVEASSGSTASSCAYFARLLGLKFIAFVPAGTSNAKIVEVEQQGGHVRVCSDFEAARRAALDCATQPRVHFLDQFANACRDAPASDGQGIGSEALQQHWEGQGRDPDWFVLGVGTGGTLSSVACDLRRRASAARICLADPQSSVYHRLVRGCSRDGTEPSPPLVEGIGSERPRSRFAPSDAAMAVAVPDAASIAAARVLTHLKSLPCGPSSGTNLCAAAVLTHAAASIEHEVSIVTILADHGKRYEDTIFDDAWLAAHGLKVSEAERQVAAFLEHGLAVAWPR